MDIILLSFILIVLRLLTLNLFLNIGSSASLNLVKIIKSHVPWTEVKQVVLKNWPFIIIGSLSIINWRIGNILVSKWLSIKDVAIYEISYKMFSLAYLLPVVVSTTVYPMLIKAYQEGEQSLSKMYHRIFIPYVAFGFLAFSFVYAYADFFIPLLFGDRYQSVSHYVRQMFFTILIFPTIFLQANVALTLKMEKLDMICNIFSLLINVLICVIGLSYYRDLTVVNLGLFSSFFIFHIIQDVMLVRKKISSLKNVLAFYGASILLTATYIWGSSQIGNEWMFPVFWVAVGLASFLFRKKILLMFKNET
jgi:O-antigen/teichoic acid export membrane protein